MRLTAELVGRFEQHTIVWSPLPIAVGPAPAVDIREVSTEAEMDAHINI